MWFTVLLASVVAPVAGERGRGILLPEGFALLKALLHRNPAKRLTDPKKIREHDAFTKILFSGVADGWTLMLHKQVGGFGWLGCVGRGFRNFKKSAHKAVSGLF